MNRQHVLSEEYIREHCPHCDFTSDTFADLLCETESFRLVCDHHPLCVGHLLIIPKAHLSCIGAYTPALMEEFRDVMDQAARFLRQSYGPVSSFEHGVAGQTVFHSHVHLLPYGGSPESIVPESAVLHSLRRLEDLQRIFQSDKQYLYFSIEKDAWTVDTSIAAPRFFRDRFAFALGVPERGNWKTMHEKATMMAGAAKMNASVVSKWKAFDAAR